MKAFLPDETRIAQVHLRTGDLERALGFYTGPLGLRIVENQKRQASLGAMESGSALIVLTEARGAVQRPERSIGLFHFALRYPARRDLADALARLTRQRYQIDGASDHRVSEAIYLSDPDGNGIELYTDRPRSQWVWREGQIAMSTERLDLDNLLKLSEDEVPPRHVAQQTDLGHIHLHVADLNAAERFYHEFLGLAVTQRSYPGALFLSAGGYHHHVAVNTWAGNRPPPVDSIGLLSYRLAVPEAEILYCLAHRAPLAGYEAITGSAENGAQLLRIRDPNGNWLEVQHVPSPAWTQPDQKRSQLLTKN